MNRSSTGRVVAFGEVMLRLDPPGNQRIVQASEFEVRFTGAEANAGVLLSSLGIDVSVVSKVPDGLIGDACINYLRRFGVDTRNIARGGDRLGLFYMETGAAQRASTVIYDRGHTAFQDIRAEDVPWEDVLEDAVWFHFSGTAPALGPQVQAVLSDGIAAAKARGIPVSCDLNYRAKLWGTTAPEPIMASLVADVDVLFGNEEDAAQIFGIRAEHSDVTRGMLDTSAYEQVASELAKRFSLQYVATTLRSSVSASINRWSGPLFDGNEHYVSQTYEINPIVDRVGAGDAFAGAMIYALLSKMGSQEAVEFATAASCLKHSIIGDFDLVSLREIQSLSEGNASGRVQR
jgi:2-dehydro-3-deoxygluconokinase